MTVPVAPDTVLILTPLSESEMLLDEMVTVLTSLSVRPPTEPTESPWPPEQVPPVKVMSVPELIAYRGVSIYIFAEKETNLPNNHLDF